MAVKELTVLQLAVPWLLSFVSGLSAWRPGFVAGSFCVGFVVDIVAMASSEFCDTAISSRLLVPSSPQVWHQSVEVNHHHLCCGMLLDPVDHVIDLGYRHLRAFS
jgi:hypothetical protein